MPRPRKPWTKTVEVIGVDVRLYARATRGGTIYRGVRLGGGANDRQSVGTRDRADAVLLVTTQARYEATLAHADAADPCGRFACLLALARHTGRRVNALVNLRASDVLRTRPAVEAALGAIGQPVGAVARWPHGALRFRAAYDKRGRDAVVPLSAAARGALDAYLRDHPRLGEAPLFPATNDDATPAHKMLAAYWLRRAETLGGCPSSSAAGSTRTAACGPRSGATFPRRTSWPAAAGGRAR